MLSTVAVTSRAAYLIQIVCDELLEFKSSIFVLDILHDTISGNQTLCLAGDETSRHVKAIKHLFAAQADIKTLWIKTDNF